MPTATATKRASTHRVPDVGTPRRPRGVQMVSWFLKAPGCRALAAGSRVRRRPPGRSDEPALTVGRQRDAGFVEKRAIPELAGHLLVTLIQTFAVIRELAAPHVAAESEPNLHEPIGIGQRLACRTDEVCFTAGEDRFGLVE